MTTFINRGIEILNNIDLIKACQDLRSNKEYLNGIQPKYGDLDKTVIYTKECIEILESALTAYSTNYNEFFKSWGKTI